MISKNKPQKGKMGTAYHIEKTHKKRTINCIHYDEDDFSCFKRGFILWQVGYDVCRKCKYKSSIYEESKNKISKECLSTKVKNININSPRVREVLNIANNHCELCNKKSYKLDIYIIDKTKSSKDIDSILNIIALCPQCKEKVYKNKEEYLEKIKNIVNERFNKII